MKLLYFGKLTDNSIYEEKVKEKNPYFVAQFMYESTLKKRVWKKWRVWGKVHKYISNGLFSKK